MSDAAPDLLISTLTDLLEVVVWGGLAAGLLLVWKPRLARRITVIHSAATIFVAASLVFLTWTQEGTGIVDFGSWPAISSESTGGVQFAHGIAVLNAMLLFAVAMPFLLTAVRSDVRNGSEIVRFLFLQAAVQFVLADDPVLRIAFLPLMSVCCLCGRVFDQTLTTAEIVAARRSFLFRTAGDGLMLLGTAVLVLNRNFGGNAGAASGMLLCVGALLRAASYPFFSDDDSPHDDTLERVLMAPAGIVVLLALWPLFAFVHAAAQGMLIGGVGLALLAGAVAAVRPNGGRTATAIALTGLMLAGLGSGTAEGRQGAVLLFVATTVMLPLVQGSTGRIPFFGVLLLGFGVCGSAMIFTTLILQPSTMFAGGLFIVAHLLVMVSLARNLGSDGPPLRMQATIGLICLVGVTALIAVAHLNPPALPAHSLGHPFAAGALFPAHAFEFAAVAILGAIGLTAGWMLRSRDRSWPALQDVASPGLRKASSPGHPSHAPGAFRRWLRAGFYLEEAFLLAVVLPLRGGAQLCRFFEWFIIERLWDIPRRAPAWLGRLGEPLQGGTVQMSVAAILLATAALLGVIVGLGN